MMAADHYPHEHDALWTMPRDGAREPSNTALPLRDSDPRPPWSTVPTCVPCGRMDYGRCGVHDRA